MAAPLPLSDVFSRLFWPNSSSAKPSPDGSIGLLYEWHCGCSALTTDPKHCMMTWCAQHASG
ncbi:MAG TPA: hypothetical protein VJP85_15335 [Candidatus Baltobacteraceae bacterium]|nr:hypothetical protein [Candidatus Baltobacteraceae bacterium]